MSAADIVPQLAVDNIGPKEFRDELGRAEGMRMLLGVPQDEITRLGTDFGGYVGLVPGAWRVVTVGSQW